VNMHIVGSEQEIVTLNIGLWQADILKKKSTLPEFKEKSALLKAQAVDFRLCQGIVFTFKD